MADSQQKQIWLSRAGQGDALAVAGLLATYYPVLRARADARMDRLLRSKIDPEDILQEVYLDVFRQMNHFENRGPESFVNWVLTILDSKLIDAARAMRRPKRDASREVRADAVGTAESFWNLLEQVYADSGTPSRVVRRHEALSAVVSSLTDLSEAHRQVLQLRFLDGLSVAEAATRLGKTEAAVVAMTQRALKALRESMDRLGEFTHGP